jgi:hypothetical protein
MRRAVTLLFKEIVTAFFICGHLRLSASCRSQLQSDQTDHTMIPFVNGA